MTAPDLATEWDAATRDELAPPCDSQHCDRTATWLIRMACPSCGAVVHLQCGPCAERIRAVLRGPGPVVWEHTPCGTHNSRITGMERL